MNNGDELEGGNFTVQGQGDAAQDALQIVIDTDYALLLA
jgi:hypothetical protein